MALSAGIGDAAVTVRTSYFAFCDLRFDALDRCSIADQLADGSTFITTHVIEVENDRILLAAIDAPAPCQNISHDRASFCSLCTDPSRDALVMLFLSKSLDVRFAVYSLALAANRMTSTLSAIPKSVRV